MLYFYRIKINDEQDAQRFEKLSNFNKFKADARDFIGENVVIAITPISNIEIPCVVREAMELGFKIEIVKERI